MQILMTGIDHSLAAVEIRERFSFTEREKTLQMQLLAARPSVEGCILLSTCNRTELWISASDDADCDLTAWLCETKGLDVQQYRPYFAARSGDAAVRYLYSLASGLHSRIVGEDQILAQVKKALMDARAAECCGSVLDVLFRSAVTGAKKVKTELSISTANASAVNFAIDHLAEAGMEFAGKRCLVIGNGEMGKRAASALLELGAEVTVTIREYRSGIVEVVPGCQRINYSQRYEKIPDCDIVVSATSSPNMTLTAGELSACGVGSRTVFIDLAVPRDIDPEIRNLGLELLDIDSFSVPQTEELHSQLEQAEHMLEEQQTKFRNWYECRDLLPKVDSIGNAFAEEVLFRMGGGVKNLHLPQPQKELLEAAARDAAAKELKKMLFTLRDAGGIDLLRACLTVLSGEQYHG